MDDELLQEFDRYLAHLGAGLGHADRQAGLRGYCAGLMAPLLRYVALSIRSSQVVDFLEIF